ncbi:MAG: sialate O-acetylesterase [Alphaproteobacteria bacterium]|nr:sialate O-acetylesterase [Alphaproteobacteria bacterium]
MDSGLYRAHGCGGPAPARPGAGPGGAVQHAKPTAGSRCAGVATRGSHLHLAKGPWRPTRRELRVSTVFYAAERLAAAFPQKRIGLINCAIGGTSIAQWQDRQSIVASKRSRASVLTACCSIRAKPTPSTRKARIAGRTAFRRWSAGSVAWRCSRGLCQDRRQRCTGAVSALG